MIFDDGVDVDDRGVIVQPAVDPGAILEALKLVVVVTLATASIASPASSNFAGCREEFVRPARLLSMRHFGSKLMTTLKVKVTFRAILQGKMDGAFP